MTLDRNIARATSNYKTKSAHARAVRHSVTVNSMQPWQPLCGWKSRCPKV